jgi:hypothetical protein
MPKKSGFLRRPGKRISRGAVFPALHLFPIDPFEPFARRTDRRLAGARGARECHEIRLRRRLLVKIVVVAGVIVRHARSVTEVFGLVPHA